MGDKETARTGATGEPSEEELFEMLHRLNISRPSGQAPTNGTGNPPVIAEQRPLDSSTRIEPARPSIRIPPLKITGQNIAKGRRTRQQRIFLAEHLHSGIAELSKPTLKQAAILARVPVAAIYRARSVRKGRPPSLADQLRNASPAERAEAARALGVDRVWDEMVLPLVGAA
jgi:hypothetical protein